MKKILKSIIYTTLAIFVPVGNVHADEVVRHNSSINYGVESIIRHLNSGIDIVCDRHLGSPTFTMYTDGVSTANSIDVDMYDVMDFEIVRNTVYFCGQYNTGNSTIARVGYFDLTGLSTSTNVQVYYFDFHWLKELRAMELAAFALRNHLIAIGDGVEDDQYMVDFIDEGTYWKVTSTIIYNDSLRLSDLAVTKNNIVATSTMVKSPNRECLLWVFQKPATTGASIFQSSDISCVNIGTNFSPDVFVRSIREDVFVVAHTPWSPSGSTDIYITECDGPSVTSRYILSESSDIKRLYLRDIATEKEKNIVHLLVNMEVNGTPRSIIYEMIPGSIGSVSPVFGHSYDGVYATSLNPRSDKRHFVASGFGCANGYPYILRYRKASFGCGCLPNVINEMTRIEFKYDPNDISFPRTWENMVPVPSEKEVKEYSVHVDCSVLFRDPEEE